MNRTNKESHRLGRPMEKFNGRRNYLIIGSKEGKLNKIGMLTLDDYDDAIYVLDYEDKIKSFKPMIPIRSLYGGKKS